MKTILMVLVVLCASVSFADTILVPGSTKMTESIVRDDFTIGGGIQNYITTGGGELYEWAHIWFGVNTPYELATTSWAFCAISDTQWVASLSFNGVEVMDNQKFEKFVPTNLISMDREVRGGVFQTCYYGDPLWVNLNASLDIRPNTEVTDFDFQFVEYQDPNMSQLSFNGSFVAWGNFIHEVPEPGTITLLLAMVASIATIRRR